MRNTIYILLGANLGNPRLQITEASERLEIQIGKIIAVSSMYESEAWGVKDQPSFYNKVILIETILLPSECLQICQEIELALGRIRDKKWGARIIDIDILYFNNEIVDTKILKIPHPYIHLRNFTLLPLAEVAPDYMHPLFNKTNMELLLNSEDELLVIKSNSKDGI